jgi:hypothetical protein
MPRAEVEERLRRAAEVRRTLRRATRRLTAFGEQLLSSRAQNDDDHDVAARFARVMA